MIIKQSTSIRVFMAMLMALSVALLNGCSSRSDIGEPRTNIEAAEDVFSIGVNAYLWRATLDTLSFMPLLTADHQSGTILSDWKVNPADDGERTKVDVFIVGKELKAAAVQVTVHRETMQGGNWISIDPRPGAAEQITTAILVQARLLRRDNAPLTN